VWKECGSECVCCVKWCMAVMNLTMLLCTPSYDSTVPPTLSDRRVRKSVSRAWNGNGTGTRVEWRVSHTVHPRIQLLLTDSFIP
jgi:hypothetical protein